MMHALSQLRSGDPRRDRRRVRDGGQSTIEAAIVMPSMVFLILTLLQLTMVQHARIMTDYAAFCAARAGIVFNADPEAMRRAATIALLPTMGRSDTVGAVMTASTATLGYENAVRIPSQLPIVEVNILNPRPTDFSATNTGHLAGAEMDFDDIRTNVAKANLLEIRLRYYYRMKIPFANQILQTLFFAQTGNAWGAWRSTGLARVNPTLLGGAEHDMSRAMFVAGGRRLVPRAGQLVTAAYLREYFFPLQATYTMRMQSNAYLTNVQAAAAPGGP